MAKDFLKSYNGKVRNWLGTKVTVWNNYSRKLTKEESKMQADYYYKDKEGK